MSFCSIMAWCESSSCSIMSLACSYLRWSPVRLSRSMSVRDRMSFIFRTNCSLLSTMTSTLSMSRSIRACTSASIRILSSSTRAAVMTSVASLASRSSHLLIHASMSPCPTSSIIISLLRSAILLRQSSRASCILMRSSRAVSDPPSRTSAFWTDETTCLCNADPISISAALFWVPSRASFKSIRVFASSVTIFVVHSFPSISLSTCLSWVVACVSLSYSYGVSWSRRRARRPRFWASGPSPAIRSSTFAILTRRVSNSAGGSPKGISCASNCILAIAS
mmetsp:Transcript_64801/g.173934  ORF Transcript_64801/g.173934 Transcript_64801/m.173934 type:complete len:279 (-) Transcript_64801:195-1031(-)